MAKWWSFLGPPIPTWPTFEVEIISPYRNSLHLSLCSKISGGRKWKPSTQPFRCIILNIMIQCSYIFMLVYCLSPIAVFNDNWRENTESIWHTLCVVQYIMNLEKCSHGSCFCVTRHWSVVPICFRVTSLGQSSYDIIVPVRQSWKLWVNQGLFF